MYVIAIFDWWNMFLLNSHTDKIKKKKTYVRKKNLFYFLSNILYLVDSVKTLK